jgi:arsenate reductase (glutaredoxin)
MRIYHNPRCSKSRDALFIIQSSSSEVQVVEYLKTSPNEEELRDLLKKLNMKPYDIIRKGENIFKENYKDKQLSDDEWIKVLVENPVLIERPIVVKGDKAVIARPPEKVNELL